MIAQLALSCYSSYDAVFPEIFFRPIELKWKKKKKLEVSTQQILLSCSPALQGVSKNYFLRWSWGLLFRVKDGPWKELLQKEKKKKVMLQSEFKPGAGCSIPLEPQNDFMEWNFVPRISVVEKILRCLVNLSIFFNWLWL